jgi:bisphosphoglycerate-dependent phosphoglycerate mutase
MKKYMFLSIIASILILIGCTQPVSISLRELASEFISYFAGKEILDPIFYPNQSDKEKKKLREELGKELFNHIWADFNVHCKRDENLDSCKNRIKQELNKWTDLYTERFISLYKECQEKALHKKYQKNDILKRFKDAEECVVSKDGNYKTLFMLSRKIKNY